ncbi:MAG TPA: type II secretion system protein [Candidatus Brocadiia bacterium]|nr:type II secretion system protein [Candidatus Brocadiia bacterium]
MRCRMMWRAFTLIELLVVVAIIAILAAMLLPVLSSAREKARRSSCMTNINQMGKALESYCGEYQGYFPSYANWGVDPRKDASSKGAKYSGMVTLGSTMSVQSVYCAGNGTTADLSPCYFRTISYGIGGATHTLGTMSAAPVGAGTLAVTGHLSDLKVFVCPSGSTMPPDCTDGSYSYVSADSSGNASGSEAVNRLQGATGMHLIAGDYSALNWGTAVSANARGLQSCYSYRCVPMTYGRTDRTAVTSTFYLVDTYAKPENKMFPGCPQFKGQKQLGNRAIISDAFSRTQAADVATDRRTKDGYGKYAHQDGYTVLFGDGSAKWYGDPQSRISSFTRSTATGASGAQFASMGEDPNSTTASEAKIAEPNMGFEIWHQFDVFNNMDSK